MEHKGNKAICLIRGVVRCVVVAAAIFLLCLRTHASESAIFPSQSAKLATSTIYGLLNEVTATVRGPSASYTMTIDASDGADLKKLMEDAGVRYSLMEPYDLSLTAYDGHKVERNPQFGDATITIPVGSSMDPNRGTFLVYAVDRGGGLQKLACPIYKGSRSGYYARFLTIHFSTFAIVYSKGGVTRIAGTIASPVSPLSSEPSTDGTASASPSGGEALGKDENGKDPYANNPKTGDGHSYELLAFSLAAVLIALSALAGQGVRKGFD